MQTIIGWNASNVCVFVCVRMDYADVNGKEYSSSRMTTTFLLWKRNVDEKLEHETHMFYLRMVLK